MTSYNGTAITYDLSGNPANWRNGEDLYWTGRQLSAVVPSTGSYYGYDYNSSGIRTKKTFGISKYIDYLLDGTKIVRETQTVNGIVTDTITYYYNTDDEVRENTRSRLL